MPGIRVPLLSSLGSVGSAVLALKDYEMGKILAHKVAEATKEYSRLQCDTLIQMACSEVKNVVCYCRQLSSWVDLVKPLQTYSSVATPFWFTVAAGLGVVATVSFYKYCREEAASKPHQS